ncbi:MAG TPA: D-glycero-beta-D-manno-heptose 1-phosphate adenylyltransferase [Bdellovibrionota bacterium]|jgi:glycerol-3-phosphate cytidylyltransferase|nr:D-glycero-beta-D-manno-heptose 1-phosphate adenylyltransferase [Bdellovibrionota bacterium]
MKRKIFPDARALAEHLKKERPSKLVTTNGCFDILHVGHVEYLEASRAQGDALVVLVNTDASVKAQGKAPDRPINNENDRMRVLAALESVSYVCLFGEKTPEDAIRLLKPDVHTKGGDYTVESLPETKVIREWGGSVKIIPFVPGKSTTSLIERISKGKE